MMMPKILWVLFSVFSLLVFACPSWALQAPVLKSGQFVYTIPPNYEPPLIGKKGIQELNQMARKLHYPYFIVFAKDLPGGTDQAAAKAIDGFAEKWSNHYPNQYAPSKSQIFLLAFNPRKFRFLAGANFKTNLGFERDAHKPYTSIFIRSVKGTPKDPKTGMLNMMKAVDSYLFDHSDPARIAELKQAAIKLKAKQVREKIQSKTTLLTALMKADVQELPKDLSPYQKLLSQTPKVLKQNNLPLLENHLKSLNTTDKKLKLYQEKHQQLALLTNELDQLLKHSSSENLPADLSAVLMVLKKSRRHLESRHLETLLDPKTMAFAMLGLQSIKKFQNLKASFESEYHETEHFIKAKSSYLAHGENAELMLKKTAIGLRSQDFQEIQTQRNQLKQIKRKLTHRWLEDLERRKQMKWNGFWAFLCSLFGGGILFKRRKTYQKKQLEFSLVIEGWKSKLANANRRFLDFESEEKDSILGLKEMTGKTKLLYQSVTQGYDQINVSLLAMDAHIKACETLGHEKQSVRILGREITLYFLGNLKKATALLESPFEYDTEQENLQDLFGDHTLHIEAVPQALMADLESQYTVLREGWNELKKSADFRYRSPLELFPESLKEQLVVFGPLSKMADSPVLNPTQLITIYSELDALRWKDPLAYLYEIEALKESHQTLLESLKITEEQLFEIEQLKVPEIRFDDAIRFQDKNDPFLKSEQLQSFMGDLESLKSGDTLAPLTEKSAQILEGHAALIELIKDIDLALTTMKTIRKQYDSQLLEKECELKDLVKRINALMKYHLYVPKEKWLAPCQEALTKAKKRAFHARKCTDKHYDYSAYLSYQKAIEQLLIFDSRRKKVSSQCDVLSVRRREALTRLNNMPAIRAGHQASIQSYGVQATLSGVPYFDVNLPLDYTFLMDNLNGLESQWVSQVSSAAATYRASLTSTSSSSSGNSWGSSSSWDSDSSSDSSSSSSSSSGGDWDSSSSSSSSSGGDW